MKRLCSLLLALLSLLSAAGADKPFENPLVFGNNRLTLITPTLFRLEYALDGKFMDAPTYFAYDRSHLLRDFEVTELGGGRYEIRTSRLRIVYENDGFPFGLHNFAAYYKLNGKEKKFTNRCIFRNNLGGAIETLDRVTEAVPLDDGLLSRDGWYLIDDEGSDLLVDGWLARRDTKRHVQDQYCFVYGNDYRAALADLGAIGGRVPMTRKSIHGVWYCRYWNYTAQDYIDIVRGYDQYDFPLDNIVFDMDWHTLDATVGTGHAGSRSWTGYTWNRKLIPDPAGLVDTLHKLGVTVSANDHPHDGIRPHEAVYGDFMRAMGEDPASGRTLLFDAGDSTYMRNFFRYAHHNPDSDDLDFWWLDWQQNYLYPKVRGYEISTLRWLNHLYYRDSERDDRRGAGYSRWAGWGDHRHPIQFSGDAQANWELLAFEVLLSATSSHAGCYYWAHDIGGFRGERNPELYVRWTQFGALSAALRIHSTKSKELDRRPWLWGERETEAMRRAYHLRSELMPSVYSSVWQVHSTMVPLNRSLFIDYGEQEAAYRNPQEFLFGDLLLAAPITCPGEGEERTASQKVWFPEGEIWYDFFTHEAHEGGTECDVSKPLDAFPLFVRGGWVLPTQPYTSRPASTPLKHLVLTAYPGRPGADNTYTLYEDDGLSRDYERGRYATTELNYRLQPATVTVTIRSTEGEYDGQLPERSYTLRLPGVSSAKRVKVGRRAVKPLYDGENGLVIEIPATDIRREITVTVYR